MYKYFKRIQDDKLPYPFGPLSAKVPSQTITKTNQQVKEVLSCAKKRGTYNKICAEDKASMPASTVWQKLRNFKGKDLKDSSVRDWKNMYEKELKEKSKSAGVGEDVRVVSLPGITRGRPPLLGEKLDKYLQEIIKEMCCRRTPIGSTIVVAVARGILLIHNRQMMEEFGGSLKPNKSWAKQVLWRMGFSKRGANSIAKILPDTFDLIKEQYLIDIKSVVCFEEIPDPLIINWDQTALKLAPSLNWTMEKRGTKRVEIAAIDDKRQITAVFGASLSGDFLPVQLIFTGKTSKCLPKVDFPLDWDITCTANHWSNETTMLRYIDHIIIPYVHNIRSRLQLSPKHPAMVIFDVFKGQCVEALLKKLEENNILYVIVPANCTDKLQPLDLSINKPAKDYMKTKFQEWYGDIIFKQLDDQIHKEVDMKLSTMKPIVSHWMIDMYEYFKSKPNIIINGFKEAGICDALKTTPK
uniref:DDE-1 domain-containing protein n=1 Tax=Amphimedon queenslandica TaxID=400682 RepID=A0A1X7U120_AMPQE